MYNTSTTFVDCLISLTKGYIGRNDSYSLKLTILSFSLFNTRRVLTVAVITIGRDISFSKEIRPDGKTDYLLSLKGELLYWRRSREGHQPGDDFSPSELVRSSTDCDAMGQWLRVFLETKDISHSHLNTYSKTRYAARWYWRSYKWPMKEGRL